MPSDDKLFGPGRLRAFSPFLKPGERQQLHEVFIDAKSPAPFADELRALARRYVDDGDSTKLRAVCLLVADLCEQGWRVEIEAGRITFEPPGISRNNEQSVDDVKARVRAALQMARLRQLREPSVRQFLNRIERPVWRGDRRTSVLDLIDNGAEVARALEAVRLLPDDQREGALARVIDPVVEICEAGAKCADTGLSLIDIWRYFRHTWAHEYRSVPGRQMMILVRNAARPRRPIIGIAMLASPVMRLGARDHWIGWLRESAHHRVVTGAWDGQDFGAALICRLEASIAATRWDDLATAAEVAKPTEAVALRLEQRASGAAAAREQQLRDHYEAHRNESGDVRPHKGSLKGAEADTDWLAASEDLLFARKRADSLAQLLFAKRLFHAAGVNASRPGALDQLFTSRSGQRALDVALTEFRKAGLSSEIADVSICGAIQPYNQLLGGKLVALVLTSAEVRDAYARRYSGQTSVIASQMAGRPIQKPAHLRILTTTSLYGVGSSQYNRLVLRAGEHEGLTADIEWGAIGKSLTGGFGTLHLGGETAQALRSMALARHDSRRVNNRFGEGTSPRLRQIREGLDALGLSSDAILHHATPRIFYGSELIPGARSALMGMGDHESTSSPIAAIARAWRRRWLSGRIMRDQALDEVRHQGPASVRAMLHPDEDDQLLLPMDGP